MARATKKNTSLDYLRGDKEIKKDDYQRVSGFKKTYFYKKMNGVN